MPTPDELLAALTLEEKAAMTAGADVWHAAGCPRLGIAGLKMTDGPSGARGAGFTESTSACFPCGTALAATWDPALVREVGAALGEEARTKGARVLLAPTVNLHRTPIGGRNFESYSEDPHLAARTAVAFVEGVQGVGVATTVKHLVANDQEHDRMTVSVEVDERALRELYLVPFEAAVREAGSWGVMAAYNRLDGTYCCEHRWLLTDLLKGEWGFEGFVVSDWFATHSTVPAALAGLDVEMPGPPHRFGPRLLEAVRAGEVPEAVVDDKVRRVLVAADALGALADPADEAPEASVDRPEHRALARRAASEAIVLLRNVDGALPLRRGPADGGGFGYAPLIGPRTLAVIGPGAARLAVQGGGSARVVPHDVVSPLDGIRAAVGDEVEVVHEPGCTIRRSVPPLDRRRARTAAGDAGLDVAYHVGTDLAGEPVAHGVLASGRQLWMGPPAPGIEPGDLSVRVTATFVPDADGRWTFGLVSIGPSRLLLDGRVVVDNTSPRPGETFFGLGSEEATGTVDLEAGASHRLTVEYRALGAGVPLAGLVIGASPPVADDLMERAVAAAAAAGAAVVVVGTDDEWETEGRDREGMELPGDQDELVRRVAAVNPRTVVLVNAGSPVAMDWADDVPAIAQVWFPGEEGGHAIADVLFGDSDPGGRLPTTIPYRLADTPAFAHYPGVDGRMRYGEGLLVGYRHYDTNDVAPRFGFGHGLSYTTFEYGPLAVADRFGRGESLPVSLEVTNTGAVAGTEVVQLYVRDVESRLARPDKELAAFVKVHLPPGATTTVQFELGSRAFSCWDPDRHDWVAEPGDFELLAARSSRDVRATAVVRLTDPAAG